MPMGRVGVLLAAPIVAFGAAARTHLSDRAHVPTGLVSAPVVALFVVGAVAGLAGLLALLRRAIRRRRSRDDEPVRVLGWTASRRAQVAALLAVGALIAVPVWIAVTVAGGSHSSHRTTPTTPLTSAAPATPPPRAHHRGSGPSLEATLIAVVVLVGAGAAGLLVARGRRSEAGAPASSEHDVEMGRALRVGLHRGAAALDSTDDVRTAITRCYTALERALDEAGLVPSPVRTPSELLTAAIGERLVPPDPATALTRLFERARFSRDPLTEYDRDAARAALAAAEVRTR
jgi:hypothetical protein